MNDAATLGCALVALCVSVGGLAVSWANMRAARRSLAIALAAAERAGPPAPPEWAPVEPPYQDRWALHSAADAMPRLGDRA